MRPGAVEVGDVLVVAGGLAAALLDDVDGEVGIAASALAGDRDRRDR
jgi:hypothetical protein